MKRRIILVSICAQLISWGTVKGSSAFSPESNISSGMTAKAAPIVSPDQDDRELLRRVGMANEGLYASLQSFVCEESILRYRKNLTSQSARHLDSVTAKVSFENGTEQYTDIRQNNVSRASLSNVPGAWSEGEYGTLLRQTQQLLRAEKVRFVRDEEQDGRAVAVYSFDVPEGDTPWTLIVGGSSYRLPFRTEVVVERSTGQIVKVARTSERVLQQLGISEIKWAVTLAPVTLGGATWLLPSSGEYSVLYLSSNHLELNRLSFSKYRRYGSEVALRFDGVK